jgi:hypothetical protein
MTKQEKLIGYAKGQGNVAPFVFETHEGDVTHSVVFGPTGFGMSVDYSSLRLTGAEVAKVTAGETDK